MPLIDAHCHLAILNRLMPVEPLIEEARTHGIDRWLSNALTKEEAAWYLSHPLPGLRFSAGIHPNYDDCDLDLADISQLCEAKKIWAVGEIGLDRNNLDMAWQIDTLTKQLELAAMHKLPVVLHLIGRQVQAYEILRRYPLRYLVHSYAGSLEGFTLLCRLDCHFTLSARLLKHDKHELLRAMVAHGAYLFETDITRHYVQEARPNPLLRLLGVFSSTAELCEVSGEELLAVQEASWRYLAGLEA